MAKWPLVRLGDVCEINPPKQQILNMFEGKEVSFVPMSSVDEIGNIDVSDIRPFSDVSNGYSYFIENDVLFAKITPCMENGKGAIARGLKNGVGAGSTEFHILRADVEKITSEWIYRFLSLPMIRKFAEINMTGSAGQKRVPKTFLENLKIPLPPIDIQKNIANIFDKTQEIIDGHKKQLAELDNLIMAVFYAMFGDPVINEKGWKRLQLSELGELKRGVSKHRPRNAPELLGGIYPLIQTGDVANSDLYIKEYSQTYSEIGLRQSKMWPKGTLCITIAANIAKTAILGFDACFPDSVVGFWANEKTNNIFIHYWFVFFQSIIEAQAPESAQKNINLRILNGLQVINPPINLQSKFAEIVTKIEEQKALVKQAIIESEHLFNSLMSEYFD